MEHHQLKLNKNKVQGTIDQLSEGGDPDSVSLDCTIPTRLHFIEERKRALLDEVSSRDLYDLMVMEEGKKDVNYISCVKHEFQRPTELSDLPEGVAVDILSRLPVKDAAATSFTSKLWENFWTYSSALVFLNCISDFPKHEPLMKVKEREKFVCWVTDAIKKCNRQKLKKFHILFDLDSSYKNCIDDWVKFCVEHNVEDLILELVSPFDPLRNNYSFPKWIEGQFLHVLVIENVDLDDETFENISHWKALDKLSVTGATGLEHIKMVDSSIHVKSLVVKHCWNLKSIDISDVQLESLQFEGRPICLDLKRVPSLLEVSLCENDLEFLKLAIEQLGSCLPQLRTLKLDNSLSFLVDENVVFHIPQLPELDYLELRISADDANVLLQLASFLDASPRLQKLSLKVDFLETEVELFKAESRPHNNLQMVEVVGFCDCKAATDIFEYILNNTVELQKLVINPVLPWCEMRYGRKSDENVKKEERGRRHALSLREKMLPSLDFVCL